MSRLTGQQVQLGGHVAERALRGGGQLELGERLVIAVQHAARDQVCDHADTVYLLHSQASFGQQGGRRLGVEPAAHRVPGARATLGIAQQGHRDVQVIAIERAEHAPSGAEGVVARRLRGYRTAYAPAGVTIGDDDVVVGPATFAGGLDAIQRTWLAGRRPTAILAMSDAMAIGAMRALRDLRLTIPGDVSVVGFDDIEMAETTDPPLTTIHQPIRGKGEEAVRLLMALIAGQGQPPEHRRLATHLVVRASTAAAPTRQGR